ncbi:MAG TPA: ATP phosphoribosyltransferase [Thermoanaerobaculia bacterium]|nr:ATP phosphoribosyltransferase [Thermoanaerobaculia bacterium]
MIRLALPKGRNLDPALAAFRAAGIPLLGLDPNGRSLRTRLDEGVEVLSLKDWDLPLYVEHGVADLGIVGSDVLGEVDGDLLVPVRLREGRSRMSLIGRSAEAMPQPGGQVRLATKYVSTARRVVAERPWGAEIVKLSGSIELAPLLHLAELALDIVQTGRTLQENGLVEIEVVAEVAACLVVNRASYQRHRALLNEWIGRLEAAEVVS